MRRLELLQWTGLLVGALMWGTAHIAGYGATEATCNGAASVFGIDQHVWEGVLSGVTAAVALAAAAASVAVLVLTRDVSYEDDPPIGRVRFFAIAALLANVLFIAMIVLYAVGTAANTPCRQA